MIATKAPAIIFPYMKEWAELPKGELTCPHCGHTGEDVRYHYEHLGGHGDVWMLECDNVPECWQRWERNGGYKGEARL